MDFFSSDEGSKSKANFPGLYCIFSNRKQNSKVNQKKCMSCTAFHVLQREEVRSKVCFSDEDEQKLSEDSSQQPDQPSWMNPEWSLLVASLTELLSGQPCQCSSDRCTEFLAAHSHSSILRRESTEGQRGERWKCKHEDRSRAREKKTSLSALQSEINKGGSLIHELMND